MRNIRRDHGSTFKAKIVLEAVTGEKTIEQLSSDYEVHANQIQRGLRGSGSVFLLLGFGLNSDLAQRARFSTME